MPRSERIRIWSIDWRGWIALAWALWFGMLYANMIIEKRGGKVRAMLRPSASAKP
jgi:hypothetical protein